MELFRELLMTDGQLRLEGDSVSFSIGYNTFQSGDNPPAPKVLLFVSR